MSYVRINPATSKQLEAAGIFLEPNALLFEYGRFGQKCRMTSQASIFGTSLGAYTSIQSQINWCDIGNYCLFAEDIRVAFPHPLNLLTVSPVGYAEGKYFEGFGKKATFQAVLPTFIGHDVWLGMSVKIKAGVHIGNGVIAGTGAVITHDIPDFSIVGGVPARLIRMRFSDKIIERIQQCQWFRYDWAGIDLDWQNAERTLDIMEEYIAEHKVPLPKIYGWKAENHVLKIRRIPGIKPFFQE